MLDPRNVAALGFLGIVYQMMDEIDNAILKYHEVRDVLFHGSQLTRIMVIVFPTVSKH